MDYDQAKFWWNVAMTVLVGGIFLYTYLANKSDTNSRNIKRLDDRIGVLDKDMVHINTQINHLPSQQDMGQLHEKINALARDVSQMRGQMKGLDHSLRLLNEYLLNQEKK